MYISLEYILNQINIKNYMEEILISIWLPTPIYQLLPVLCIIAAIVANIMLPTSLLNISLVLALLCYGGCVLSVRRTYSRYNSY